MANIISKEKCIVIDGVSIPLNSMTCNEITNGAMLSFLSGVGQIRLMVIDTTLDGDPVTDRAELITYLQDNCFSIKGGGSGGGAVNSVTGNLVTGTDSNPIIDFPIGNNREVPLYKDGSVVAGRLGWSQYSDLPTPPPFLNGVLIGTAFNPDGSALFGFLEMALGDDAQSFVLPNSFPVYNPGIIGNGGGTLPVADGVQISDAVNLGQINLKVDKVDGKGLSDANFTSAEKSKLASLSSFDPSVFQTSLDSKENTSEKGQALGYTPLDASGHVPLEHLNISGLQFKGAWNPNTNTPTIVDGTGSVGDFYKASEAGSFNSGNGNFTYAIGDWVIFAGGIWQRLGSTDLVASVNGKLGMVVITKSDVGLSNVDNVSATNLRDRSTHTGTQPLSTITDLVTIINAINSANDAQTTAIQSKANFPGTNQHVPIRTVAGAQGSFPFATPATANTFVFRDGNGRFAASTPVSANDVVNKTYADKAGLISSTTTSAVTIREFTDRFEYTTKNVISSLSIPAAGTAYPIASYLPVGVTIAGCDELSCTQYSASTGRYIYVGVRDGSDRRVVVEFGNLTNASITWSGTIFVKLVKYK